MKRKARIIRDLTLTKSWLEDLKTNGHENSGVVNYLVSEYNQIVLSAVCATTGTDWVDEPFMLLTEPASFLINSQ